MSTDYRREFTSVGTREGQRRLSREDKVFMLWAMYHGHGAFWTARRIGCNESTVRMHERTFKKDPGYIFHMPILVRKTQDRLYCRICGGVVFGKRTAVQRHVLSHFFTPWEMEDIRIAPGDWRV